MKKSVRFMRTAAMCFVLLLSPIPSSSEMQLAGSAEDLWGNPIELSQYKKGILLLYPFSPSF